MSIASEIQRLQTAKADIKTALESKGITVPSSLKIDGYAQLINDYLQKETRVVTKFNVTDTSNPTPIGFNEDTSGFSKIEIDGVEQPSVVSAYTFDTVGEHTIKYTLTDPTSIGERAFNRCSGLTSIDIPNSVTSIDWIAFNSCTSLTSIEIPSGVTEIGNWAFSDCSSLTSIVCNATTAPTISLNTFQNVKSGGTLYVPIGSSGYDIWTDYTDYLGKYYWTRVEQ